MKPRVRAAGARKRATGATKRAAIATKRAAGARLTLWKPSWARGLKNLSVFLSYLSR